jgi:hypothetical protein
MKNKERFINSTFLDFMSYEENFRLFMPIVIFLKDNKQVSPDDKINAEKGIRLLINRFKEGLEEVLKNVRCRELSILLSSMAFFNEREVGNISKEEMDSILKIMNEALDITEEILKKWPR